MNCKKNVSVEPLRFFINGAAGVGKSHLMKIICMFLIKTMNLYSGLAGRSKVLILAPTGARNFTKAFRFRKSKLRNLYSEVAVVRIDEISMVSNIRLLHVN